MTFRRALFDISGLIRCPGRERSMRKCLAIAGMIIVGWVAAPTSLAAQTLDKIKERGVLVVGTKADYKPFGFRDPTGAIIGFEPDLAREVADRLGVKLQLEPVVSAN